MIRPTTTVMRSLPMMLSLSSHPMPQGFCRTHKGAGTLNFVPYGKGKLIKDLGCLAFILAIHQPRRAPLRVSYHADKVTMRADYTSHSHLRVPCTSGWLILAFRLLGAYVLVGRTPMSKW